MIASDDSGQFYISPNANRAEQRLVASTPTGPLGTSGIGTPLKKSNPIALEAGQVYAVEALVKEGRAAIICLSLGLWVEVIPSRFQSSISSMRMPMIIRLAREDGHLQRSGFELFEHEAPWVNAACCLR